MTNDSWFAVRVAEPGIHIIEEPHHIERVKSYLVTGQDRAVLIDTGMGVGNIREVVEGITSLPVTVVNSHAHWDHVGGNHLFDEILIHPAEAADLAHGFPNARMRAWFAPSQLTGPLPEGIDLDTLAIPPSRASGMLAEGDVIDLGGRGLEVLHCPGHSPGGIVLLDRANGILFSTDVAYRGYLYAYAGPSLGVYFASLQRLAAIAPVVRVVYPSHDDSPISPELLHPIAEAMEVVADHGSPDEIRDDRQVFDFGEFGVFLFPPRYQD